MVAKKFCIRVRKPRARAGSRVGFGANLSIIRNLNFRTGYWNDNRLVVFVGNRWIMSGWWMGMTIDAIFVSSLVRNGEIASVSYKDLSKVVTVKR